MNTLFSSSHFLSLALSLLISFIFFFLFIFLFLSFFSLLKYQKTTTITIIHSSKTDSKICDQFVQLRNQFNSLSLSFFLSPILFLSQNTLKHHKVTNHYCGSSPSLQPNLKSHSSRSKSENFMFTFTFPLSLYFLHLSDIEKGMFC